MRRRLYLLCFTWVTIAAPSFAQEASLDAVGAPATPAAEEGGATAMDRLVDLEDHVQEPTAGGEAVDEQPVETPDDAAAGGELAQPKTHTAGMRDDAAQASPQPQGPTDQAPADADGGHDVSTPSAEANETEATVKEMPPTAVDDSWFAPGQPAYYGVAYGADWAFVALSAGLQLSGAPDSIRPAWTLLGPAVTEEGVDPGALFDSRLDALIGRPMLQEKVPVPGLIAAQLSMLSLAAIVDGVSFQDFHRTHSLVLGAAVATMLTLDVTDIMKLTFGRLRPDFRERYLRAACQGIIQRPDNLDCQPVDDGFEIDRNDYVDGFKSFPSGHASSSFALATYLSMWVGSTWLWGDDASAFSRPIAVLGMGGLFSGALYTAASRVNDNRHHVEDVAVGAALGASIGLATWCLYFDASGSAHWRTLRVVPSFDPTEPGVSVTGTF